MIWDEIEEKKIKKNKIKKNKKIRKLDMKYKL
jgi:hypothetical protein